MTMTHWKVLVMRSRQKSEECMCANSVYDAGRVRLEEFKGCFQFAFKESGQEDKDEESQVAEE